MVLAPAIHIHHGGTNKIPSECLVHKRISSKSPSHKMVDTSKDELLLGGEIRHLTAILQYHTCLCK